MQWGSTLRVVSGRTWPDTSPATQSCAPPTTVGTLFFYFNATAFILSLTVVVLTLILNARLKKTGRRFDLPLQLLMGTAALAFIAAYGTGACWDKFRVVVFFVFLAILVLNIMLQSLMLGLWGDDEEDEIEKNLGKLMAPLSMFALTISYMGGLSTPGGFWDSAEGGHRPGDAILRSKLLHLFFYFNTGQFASSLFGVFLLMCSGLQVRLVALFMKISLLYLIVAYTVGSSRGRHTSITVICSLFAAVGGYVILYVAIRGRFSGLFEKLGGRFSCLFEKAQGNEGTGSTSTNDGTAGSRDDLKAVAERQRRRASSLVQLLAGLAVSVTYQAGMYPPGGVWQDGHKAGDPILLTTNPTRYKAFFYCNSVAFVASLLAILLGQKSYLSEHHALQATMILDLLSLVVAYAIGSCRDQISSMYAVGIAGAAVVYVVVHVQYFTLGLGSADKDDDDAATSAMVDKKGGRFILFAILVASITYQAGLTPPGGFLLQDDILCGHRVGDPVLLCNNPVRYKVFFYCNSVSFTTRRWCGRNGAHAKSKPLLSPRDPSQLLTGLHACGCIPVYWMDCSLSSLPYCMKDSFQMGQGVGPASPGAVSSFNHTNKDNTSSYLFIFLKF
ncbi:hypothetical protein QYE76_013195 [Lolium multiflorum]|uniref:PGG domain-containing protein n=1 Tax=Lolium multiflorum TaxID=4521 RepID=A0AAD8X4C4_LOLMU|nr:hypothetical protein QYE76_013195 [Lolium multiflorum]